MELDSCTSSDALLMNIFCYPGVSRDDRVSALLGAEPGTTPRFGYKARVPLSTGRLDRTEVDMHLGSLLVEAKLTESDFQRARKEVLLRYRDFSDVFDAQQLPQTDKHYLSYQLLRNVLAAYALQCSFCVLADARRPDLANAWYAVMKCVKPVELRTKLRISTWQEVSRHPRPQAASFSNGQVWHRRSVRASLGPTLYLAPKPTYSTVGPLVPGSCHCHGAFAAAEYRCLVKGTPG